MTEENNDALEKRLVNEKVGNKQLRRCNNMEETCIPNLGA